MRLLNLKVLVERWVNLHNPLEFKLVAYFYRLAADTADGIVGRPRQEIAIATGILARKIRRLLQRLGEGGVIEVVSLAEENTVVRVLREYWSLPPAISISTPAASPAVIKQRMFRLTGKRATLEDIQELKVGAGVDYEGLVRVLDCLLHRGCRYEGFQLLAGATAHQFLVWERPMEYWETSVSAPVFSALEQSVGARMDEWLKTLSPAEFKIVMFLFVAAAESPDGLAAHSMEAIAVATAMTCRTVRPKVHDLATRGVLGVVSQEKECTLVRFPGCHGWYGLPPLTLPILSSG